MADKIALMSIMTKQCNKIFSGTKVWEFRKRPPRLIAEDNLDIIVYSSKIDKAIVGRFRVEQILCCKLEELMKRTGYENDPEAVEWFREYYHNKELCSAIKITDPVLFKKPITLSMIKKDIPSFRPPQNFNYVKPDDKINMLIKSYEGMQ